MKKGTKKFALILALAIVVPVFMWQQVSFLGATASAGTEHDKTDAIAALAKYKNAADYRDAEKATLANAITAGTAAITNAIDSSGVKTALSSSEGVIDQIKTNATLTAEENAAKAKAEKQAATDEANSNISDLQKKLEKEQKAKEKLQQNLGQIQKSVSIVNLDISKTKSVIQDTAQTISRKEAEVKNLNDKIELQKNMLKGLFQQLYYNQDQPILNVVLTSESFADIFSDTDHLLTVEDRIRQLSGEISQAKTQVEQDKADLEIAKQKHEKTLNDKVDQKQDLVADQVDVQGDIQEKEATIAELQQKLTKLKNDLSSLLGTVVSTNDVKEAAGIAAGATGVRKSFILAELTQESGLGRFTGGCTYENTRVKPADATVFKQIMKELGYGINSKKISCAGKIGYGGAMGIAQFMPTTWTGYKSYIANATGHNPPDPWSVIDGVMGMAKKLANGGATSQKGEYDASMLYYCGTTKPSSSAIKASCNNYAANVQSLAKGYENND